MHFGARGVLISLSFSRVELLTGFLRINGDDLAEWLRSSVRFSRGVVFSLSFLRGVELGRSRAVPRRVRLGAVTRAPSHRRGGPRFARANPSLRTYSGLRKAEAGKGARRKHLTWLFVTYFEHAETVSRRMPLPHGRVTL